MTLAETAIMGMTLEELSRTLYSPVTLLLYALAAFLYLYSLTTTVGRRDEQRARGRKAQVAGLVVASLGVAAHVGHEVTRAMAQDRLPLGNMFEFTSAMALVGVLTGLIYLQFIRKRPELNGFVLLAGTLVLASALLVYADPGPLMPILDTWWRALHVTTIAIAAGILTAGFVFNALHMLRDTAERGVARRHEAAASGSTVGAAYAGDVDQVADSNPGREDPDESTPDAQERHDAAYRQALRDAINPWRLALGTFLGASTVSWVFIATPTLPIDQGVAQFLAVNVGLVVAALIARWFVPFLPAAATLDGLAYRTIALGFLGWTFGVISGAMWAEQSWGRFWGWDPKETASFVTWIAYAAYLHARATAGTRGRGAGWIGLGAFAVLMFTYYAVNLVFVGLHSYAGL
jgi:cytochrome c-type biogenesis protein CcsB